LLERSGRPEMIQNSEVEELNSRFESKNFPKNFITEEFLGFDFFSTFSVRRMLRFQLCSAACRATTIATSREERKLNAAPSACIFN
jgi:hypothetical protein